nr:hypothetical protein [Angustibacter aerolatus]
MSGRSHPRTLRAALATTAALALVVLPAGGALASGTATAPATPSTSTATGGVPTATAPAATRTAADTGPTATATSTAPTSTPATSTPSSTTSTPSRLDVDRRGRPRDRARRPPAGSCRRGTGHLDRPRRRGRRVPGQAGSSPAAGTSRPPSTAPTTPTGA